jgi:hypothetical protein
MTFACITPGPSPLTGQPHARRRVDTFCSWVWDLRLLTEYP